MLNHKFDILALHKHVTSDYQTQDTILNNHYSYWDKMDDNSWIVAMVTKTKWMATVAIATETRWLIFAMVPEKRWITVAMVTETWWMTVVAMVTKTRWMITVVMVTETRWMITTVVMATETG